MAGNMFRGRSVLIASLVAFGGLGRAAHAGQLPTRYLDGAAREIARRVYDGEGWAVISSRGTFDLPGSPKPIQGIRYRVVSNINDLGMNSHGQYFIEVEYSQETPWISAQYGLPTTSMPSIELAKRARTALVSLDDLIAKADESLRLAPDDDAFKALAEQILLGLRVQRDALQKVITLDITRGKDPRKDPFRFRDP